MLSVGLSFLRVWSHTLSSIALAVILLCGVDTHTTENLLCTGEKDLIFIVINNNDYKI